MKHCAVVSEDHKVFTFGDNSYGQLGIGDLEQRLSPVEIFFSQPIVSASMSETYTLFLDIEGHFWFCGSLVCPQKEQNIPVQIDNVSDIIKISSGGQHSLLLDHKGNVFSFGENNRGQLGFDDSNREILPRKITGIPVISDICCGRYHSILLDIHGQCWGFGSNCTGQLDMVPGCDGNSVLFVHTPVKICTPPIHLIAAGHSFTVLIDINNNIYTLGDRTISAPGPRSLNVLPEIKKAYCGYSHILLVDVNAGCWVYGNNDQGQLGLGYFSPPFRLTKLKFDHNIHSALLFGNSTLIINGEGECFSFGCGSSGQLGLGDQKSGNRAQKIHDLKIYLPDKTKLLRTKNARNGL